MTLETHILTGWDASVRCDVCAPHLTPIPIPHTVPSPQGNYQALFYWDTYFTNLGLLRSGRMAPAHSNCEALMWCLDRRGFVPNSAFVGDDNRSQPPMLAAMVTDVFTITQDLAWLRDLAATGAGIPLLD